MAKSVVAGRGPAFLLSRALIKASPLKVVARCHRTAAVQPFTCKMIITLWLVRVDRRFHTCPGFPKFPQLPVSKYTGTSSIIESG